jgi:hypothetical protein
MQGFVVPRIPEYNPRSWPDFSAAGASTVENAERLLGELCKISRWCTAVARVMESDASFVAPQDAMRRAFGGWVKYWAWQSAYLNEYKYVDLPPLPETDPDDLTADGLRHIRESLAMHFISEISRFWLLAECDAPRYHTWSLASTRDDWWIEHWCQLECNPESLDAPSKAMEALREENAKKKRLEEEQGPTNADAIELQKETPEQAFKRVFTEVSPPKRFEPNSASACGAGGENNSAAAACGGGEINNKAAAAAGGGREKLWFRNICHYSQRNVYDAVMLLCERIQDYPFHQDIVTLIELLTARLGFFFLKPGTAAVFDIPRYREALGGDMYRCNRAFMAWAAAYFYELLQRVHYQRDMRVRWEPIAVRQEQVDALQRSILRFCEDMGVSTFMNMYRLSTEENYRFPGDEVFSRFLHPEGKMNHGDTLLELRSERQAPRFFSEDSVKAATIIQNILAADTHISRLCIWNILDWYFNMEVSVNFRDAVVIDQCGIQGSQIKLVESSVPCIVTLFSRPVAHHNFVYYESDDIYQVIVKWLLLIRDEKHGFLFRKDISKQIATLLENTDAPYVVNEGGPRDDFEEVRGTLLVNHYNNLVKPL